MARLMRTLTVFDGVAVVVGIIVGSGIFSKPGKALAALGSPGLALTAWVVGGAVSLLGAFVFAELGALRPAAGGVYAFLRDAYGARAGFVFAAVGLFGFKPLSIAGIARVCGDHMVRASEPGASQATIDRVGPQAAALVILGLTAANVLGNRSGARVQNIFMLAKVLALGIVIFAVFATGAVQPEHFSQSIPRDPGRSDAVAWGAAMLAVLWAYDGWADLSYLNGEVKDPGRALPRIFIGGTLAVVGLYLAVNVAYLLAIPPDRLAASRTVAADALQAAVGGYAPRIAALFIAISTFGAVNGSIMSGARIFHAAGEDRLLPAFLTRVHPVRGTPEAALFVQGILAAALVLSANFDQLTDGFVLTTWMFFVPAAASIFVFRRKMPDAPRPFRAPFYPWTPLLFIAAAIVFLWLNAVDDLADLRRMESFGWFSSAGGGPGVFDLATAIALGAIVIAWLASFLVRRIR